MRFYNYLGSHVDVKNGRPRFFLCLFACVRSLCGFLSEHFHGNLVNANRHFRHFVEVQVNLTTRGNLSDLNRRTPTVIRIAMSNQFIRRRLARALREALCNGGSVPRQRARVTRRNEIHRIALRAKGQRFCHRILGGDVHRTRISFHVFGIGQIRLIQRHTKTRLANFGLLLRMFRESVLPRIAIRVGRRHVSTLRNVGSNERVVMVKCLNDVLLTFRTGLFKGRLVTRYLPIVFQVDRVVNVMVAHDTARLYYRQADLRHYRLTFRAMSGRRCLLTRANEQDQLSIYLNGRKSDNPLFHVDARLHCRFLCLEVMRLLRHLLCEREGEHVISVL